MKNMSVLAFVGICTIMAFVVSMPIASAYIDPSFFVLDDFDYAETWTALGNDFAQNQMAIQLGNRFATSRNTIELNDDGCALDDDEFMSSCRAIHLSGDMNEFLAADQLIAMDGDDFLSSERLIGMNYGQFDYMNNLIAMDDSGFLSNSNAIELDTLYGGFIY